MIGDSLSVIMPNYNDGRLITRALTAVLKQSRRPMEVIVVDDGSTDDSVATIDAIVQRDPVVKLIRHERNLGLMAAINRGFEESRGDLVYFPAADDYILPGFFEKSLRMLAGHPQAGLSFSNFASLEGVTGEIEWTRAGPVDSEARCLTPQQLAARPAGAAPITGNTAIVRRNAFIQAGGCLAELKYASDWFNCWVVAYRHGACFLPEDLTVVRKLTTSYYYQCTRERDRKLDVHEKILRLVLSPAFADVLPFFQSGESMQVHGTDLARAACRIRLDQNQDVIALVAALREDQLAGLIGDEEPQVRQLGERAVACRLMKRNGSLEAAIAALYGKQLQLQVQVQTLQNQLSEVRNWTPLRLHRRVVPPVRKIAQDLMRTFGKSIRRDSGTPSPSQPSPP